MNTVGIFARPDLERAGPTLRELVGWLTTRGVEACLDERTARLADGAGRFTCVTGPEVAARADALLVLGGDGTLLAASRLLGDRPVPVLAVNFGSLGFLTEVTLPELFPAMEMLLGGSYRIEERRLLRASLRDSDGGSVVAGDVLNDVVVAKASLARIIELDVTVDGLFVSAFRADGLIVSSPTGSTAYNLAAGGPIVQPALPCVVLTPICPHMLSNRPLVVGDEAVIEVRLRAARECDVQVTLDGQPGPALAVNDVVTVTRSPRVLRLVKAPGRDYYEVLRTKLKWGER